MLSDLFTDGAAAEDFISNLAAKNSLGSSPGSGDFEVDLSALYKYYNDVYAVYDRLGQRIKDLKASPYANACYYFGEITGVAKSMTATVDAAVGPDNSMLGALENAQASLAKHLTDVEYVYNSYIDTDDTNASELNGASSKASQVGFNPKPTTPAADHVTGSVLNPNG